METQARPLKPSALDPAVADDLVKARSRGSWPLERTGPHRIAMFSGNFNCVRDGANRALNRLAAHALGRGHAMRIYSPTVPSPAFAPAGDLVAVPSCAIPFRSEYRFAPRLPSMLATDIRRFAPSVVHVSAPDALGAAAIRLARAIDVPVIASVHTRFETYLDYYRLGLLRPLAEAWLRRFYDRCDAVLAPSRETAEQLRANGIKATHIWSRGVDPAQFSPTLRDKAWRRSIDVADHEVVLLFFGRLVAEKGLATFEATVRALRGHGLPIRILIVGDGPERRRLVKRIPDAAFTGHLDGPALGRAIASADILINPSVTELFGNVTLEAMASGLAVVAADVAANRALVKDGHSGVLVPAISAVHYAQAVHALVREPARRRMIAEAALARAAMFDWTRTLDVVLHAYATTRRAKRPEGSSMIGKPPADSLSVACNRFPHE